MKVVALCLTLLTSAAAFSQESRRDALAKAATIGAAIVPAAANAAAGESPRFSVFGLVGDGTSYSEGAAYGTDQSKPLYSPYSVYSNQGSDSLYSDSKVQAEYVARKKAVVAETGKRLTLLNAYIDKKQWFNVRDELKRYMYETRGAVRGLAGNDRKKKNLADAFFKAIEETDLQATLKNQEKCAAAAAESIKALDAFAAAI